MTHWPSFLPFPAIAAADGDGGAVFMPGDWYKSFYNGTHYAFPMLGRA